MAALFRKLSIIPKGLRYKLTLAFCLMSIIPLLVCAYLAVNFVFPNAESIYDISLVLLFSLFIALLGLYLVRMLVEPIIDMAIEAKVIAGGQFGRKIVVKEEDEIGDLGNAINLMSERIKSNIEELKSYGQKTREIDIAIHKKVLTLSSLLQISDVISSGAMKLDEILALAIEMIAQIEETGFGVLFMPDEEGKVFSVRKSFNIEGENLEDITFHPGEGILGNTLLTRSILVIDKSTEENKDIANFKKVYGVKNLVVVPVYSGKRNLALLLAGNRLEDFKYSDDDLDMFKTFAKQIAIGIENDVLLKKIEELAITDELTGLFNRNYITQRLEEEIKRAIFYQRPCSFLVFNIDDYKKFREEEGELVAEDVLKKFAKIVKEKTGPIGKAARIGGDEFAILLPEKNKKEATDIAEGIRKSVELTPLTPDKARALTVSGGVAENPLDGSTAEDIFNKALDGLNKAKSKGKNRVVA